MKLLLIDGERGYEDFGGKIDNTDLNIQHAAAREISEETNNVINEISILNRIQQNNSEYIYLARSKYIMYFVEATEQEKNLKSYNFGNKEIYENIPRKVRWISLDTILDPKSKVFTRIRNKTVFGKLQRIKMNKFGINLV